jgi:hypothetical protein
MDENCKRKETVHVCLDWKEVSATNVISFCKFPKMTLRKVLHRHYVLLYRTYDWLTFQPDNAKGIIYMKTNNGSQIYRHFNHYRRPNFIYLYRKLWVSLHISLYLMFSFFLWFQVRSKDSCWLFRVSISTKPETHPQCLGLENPLFETEHKQRTPSLSEPSRWKSIYGIALFSVWKVWINVYLLSTYEIWKVGIGFTCKIFFFFYCKFSRFRTFYT